MKYLIILCILTTGCASADLVRTQYKPQKGGTVRYLNQGAGFVINGRIKDAKEKMHEFCGGDYDIMAEGSQDQFAGQYGGFPMNSNYKLIEFQCVN